VSRAAASSRRAASRTSARRMAARGRERVQRERSRVVSEGRGIQDLKRSSRVYCLAVRPSPPGHLRPSVFARRAPVPCRRMRASAALRRRYVDGAKTHRDTDAAHAARRVPPPGTDRPTKQKCEPALAARACDQRGAQLVTAAQCGIDGSHHTCHRSID
jgi:hypothetical protein